ncbi:hypothetical protein [Paractinoplanes rishiriensis]|uniref:hypothetical protein n=1 Tax=Paractinoplanes rishiriensis TaxID=1050105 RepID=UPI001943869E|nr:hypothetical protein [Actinoplanes rishiriensis]
MTDKHRLLTGSGAALIGSFLLSVAGGLAPTCSPARPSAASAGPGWRSTSWPARSRVQGGLMVEGFVLPAVARDPAARHPPGTPSRSWLQLQPTSGG